MASCSCRSTASEARPRSPTSASRGTRTSSKVTVDNRRVRSTVCSGTAVTPGASRGHQHLGHAPVGASGDQQLVCLCAELDRLLDAIQHQLLALGPDLEGHRAELVVRRRLAVAPGRDHLSGQESLEDAGLCIGASRVERGGHHVGREEGTGRGAPSELVGEQAEVDDPLPAHAAATSLLADEEGGPPELGTSPPVPLVETGGVVSEVADLRDGSLLVEELGGRLLEELLVGSQLQQHDLVPLTSRTSGRGCPRPGGPCCPAQRSRRGRPPGCTRRLFRRCARARVGALVREQQPLGDVDVVVEVRGVGDHAGRDRLVGVADADHVGVRAEGCPDDQAGLGPGDDGLLGRHGLGRRSCSEPDVADWRPVRGERVGEVDQSGLRIGEDHACTCRRATRRGPVRPASGAHDARDRRRARWRGPGRGRGAGRPVGR